MTSVVLSPSLRCRDRDREMYNTTTEVVPRYTVAILKYSPSQQCYVKYSIQRATILLLKLKVESFIVVLPKMFTAVALITHVYN